MKEEDFAQGALTYAAARDGSTIVSETKYTGIDTQGRVTASLQKTAGLPEMPFACQYSATGQLLAVQYPLGRWVSYDINGANRLKAVRNGPAGVSYYLQNAGYKPDGSLAGATVAVDGDTPVKQPPAAPLDVCRRYPMLWLILLSRQASWPWTLPALHAAGG